MSSTQLFFIKLAFTLFPILAIVIAADAFYNAVILGDKFIYASTANMDIITMSYLAPIIISIAVIFAIWTSYCGANNNEQVQRQEEDYFW